MEKQRFFRVGNLETNDGLWYSQDGEFHGNIHKKYTFLSCSGLPMPYDAKAVGYLSCTKTFEELKAWFTPEDLKSIAFAGYYIAEFESDDYFEYENHWLIKTNAKVMKVFKEGYPE